MTEEKRVKKTSDEKLEFCVSVVVDVIESLRDAEEEAVCRGTFPQDRGVRPCCAVFERVASDGKLPPDTVFRALPRYKEYESGTVVVERLESEEGTWQTVVTFVDEVFVNPNDNIVAASQFYAAAHASIGEAESFDENFWEIAKEYLDDDEPAFETFGGGARKEPQADKLRVDLISPLAEKRLAERLGDGAKKYGDRNWERGIPVSRTLASALRHLAAYRRGERDEDHLAAAYCNLMFALHTEEAVKRGVLPETLLDVDFYDATDREGDQNDDCRHDA